MEKNNIICFSKNLLKYLFYIFFLFLIFFLHLIYFNKNSPKTKAFDKISTPTPIEPYCPDLTLKNCRISADFNKDILPRLELIKSIVSSSNIRPETKEVYEKTITELNKLQYDKRIKWFLYFSKAIRGRAIVEKNNISIIVPQITAESIEKDLKADQVLGATFHEIYHAKLDVDRLENNIPFPSAEEHKLDEILTYFYDFLLRKFVRNNQITFEELNKELAVQKNFIIDSYGVDYPEIVYRLDKLNQGPDSKIFRYLIFKQGESKLPNRDHRIFYAFPTIPVVTINNVDKNTLESFFINGYIHPYYLTEPECKNYPTSWRCNQQCRNISQYRCVSFPATYCCFISSLIPLQ